MSTTRFGWSENFRDETPRPLQLVSSMERCDCCFKNSSSSLYGDMSAAHVFSLGWQGSSVFSAVTSASNSTIRPRSCSIKTACSKTSFFQFMPHVLTDFNIVTKTNFQISRQENRERRPFFLMGKWLSIWGVKCGVMGFVPTGQNHVWSPAFYQHLVPMGQIGLP